MVYVKEGGRTAQGTAQRNHAKRQQRHMMPSCVMHVAALRSPNQWTRPTSLAFSRADGSFSALLFLLLAPSGHCGYCPHGNCELAPTQCFVLDPSGLHVVHTHACPLLAKSSIAAASFFPELGSVPVRCYGITNNLY